MLAVVQGLEADLAKLPESEHQPMFCEIHNCTPIEKLANVLLSAATVEPLMALQRAMGLKAWVRFVILTQLLKSGMSSPKEGQVTGLVDSVMEVLDGDE